MYKEKDLKSSLLCLLIFFFFEAFTLFVTKSQNVHAQYWAALPPYNTLWPLWSPVLSPVNGTTGLPTPLVTSLMPNTILPAQPALTWATSMGYPWLLYNTQLGLAYYDPYLGINLWPPKILNSIITGLPITLTLPTGYEYLSGPPSLAAWLLSNVPAANTSYQIAYSSLAPVGSLFVVSPAPLLTGPYLLSGISALYPPLPAI